MEWAENTKQAESMIPASSVLILEINFNPWHKMWDRDTRQQGVEDWVRKGISQLANYFML